MEENADTLWEIDAVWLTLHSYFASTITFDIQLIRRNFSRSFWR